MEPLKHGIQPFWFWNGEMEDTEIIRQIGEMKAQGLTGFLIHPRQGMEIPYLSRTFFEKVRVAVKEAKKLGNSRVFNLIVLGIAAQHMDFTKEQWYSVIEHTVPPKTIDVNKAAFDAGYCS